MIFEGIKVSDYPFDELTVQGIFLHNHNWDVYRALHNSSLRDEVVSEVAKMLSCRDDECGFVEFFIMSQESLAQKKLDDFSKKPPWICPKCQSTMVIVRFRKKPPPPPTDGKWPSPPVS